MAKGYPRHKLIGYIGAPLVFIALLLMPLPEGMTPEGRRLAAVAALMALWWITEAIHISATALLPLALFPLLGIMSAKDAAAPYADPNIFLFAGGFFIAMALQKWDAHERIALYIMRRAGTAPRRLVLGFMISTAFLSMWISNTATAVMMAPIGMAVVGELKGVLDDKERHRFTVAVMLGIAYAANIGGIATLIGTPPNVIFAAQLRTLYPEAPAITFSQWFLFGLPFAAVFLPLAWLILVRVLYRLPEGQAQAGRTAIDAKLARLGPMSAGERAVLSVAGLAALSWMTRGDLELGIVTVPGWQRLFPWPDYINDATVALFFASVLFILPVGRSPLTFALDWEWARRIPWGILILFGGGLALADGFKETGLVTWLGLRLDVLSGVPPLVMVLAVAFLMTFVTELTSNTATTTIMLPILAVTASETLHVNPLLLMIPATLSASCAFMLPVATPPNAVIFASGELTIPEMARAGLVLNLLGILLVTSVVYLLVPKVMPLELGVFPPWAGLQP